MFDVFISYRRSDGMELALEIYNFLTAKGLRVFLDKEKMVDSQYFNEQIVDKLTEAPHYILLATSAVLPFKEKEKEDWVRDEVKLALELYEKEKGSRSFGVIVPDGSSFLFSGFPEEFENLGKPNQIQLKGVLPDQQEYQRILKSVIGVNRRNLWYAGHRWLENSREKGSRFSTLRLDERLMPTAQTEGKSQYEIPICVYQKTTDEDGREQTNCEQPIMDVIASTTGNLYLIGQGGIGKTASLIHIMTVAYDNKKYSNTAQIPLFIELSHAPDNYGKLYEAGHSSFIRRAVYQLLRTDRRAWYVTERMVEEIDDVFNADPAAAVEPVTDLFTAQTPAPEYLLLLDGLNEVSRKNIDEVGCSVIQMIIEEIRFLGQCRNVRIILTSRSDEETISRDIARLYLSGVNVNIVSEYMRSRGIGEKEIQSVCLNKELLDILRIPLFLTLYTCLRDRNNIVTRGDIFRNFFSERRKNLEIYTAQSRIASVEEDVKNSGSIVQDNRVDAPMQYFMIDFLLPEIAWHMEQAGEFYFDIEEIQNIIFPILSKEGDTDVCGRYGKKLYDKYRDGANTVSHTKQVAGKLLRLSDDMERVTEIIVECFVLSLGFMQESHGSFGFVHQHIRDYFAAVRNVNNMRMAVCLAGEGVLSAFTCLKEFNDSLISKEVSRFTGEYLGEHNNVSIGGNKNEGNTVLQESCDQNLIMRTLDLYRGKFEKEGGYGVWNLIDILYRNRGTLTNVNLSKLDLTLCNLNGIDICGVDLTGALVPHYTLFPELRGGLKKAIFSPDGKYFLTVEGGNTVKLWDVRLLKTICTFTESARSVNDVAFSWDGNYLAIAMGIRTEIWDVKNCQRIRSIKGGSFRVAFSPDGQYLAICSFSKKIKIWDTQVFHYSGKLSWHSTKGDDKAIEEIMFSPDGHFIAAFTHWGHFVKVWSMDTLQCIKGIECADAIQSIAFSSDNRFIIISSGENVYIRNTSTYEVIATLEGHVNLVTSARFILNDKYIVTASDDYSIKIWDSKTYQCIETLIMNIRVKHIDSSLSGKRFLSLDDLTVQIWDAVTFQRVGILENDLSYLNDAAFSPDGNHILLSGGGRTVPIWDADKYRYESELIGHLNEVTDVMFSFDGSLLATLSWRFALGAHNFDGTAKIWDASSYQLLGVIAEHRFEIISVFFDAESIITVSADCEVKYWSTDNYQCIKTLRFDDGMIDDADFSPDGRYIITYSLIDSVKIWETTTWKCNYTLEGHGLQFWVDDKHVINNDFYPKDILYTPDGQFILIGGHDVYRGIIIILDAKTYHLEGILKKYNFSITRLFSSSDGHFVAAWDTWNVNSSDVVIWDIRSKNCVSILHGNVYNIQSVKFSPDNHRILIASYDGTAKIWDIKTGKCLKTLKYISGLKMKGADLRYLHPDSDLSEEDMEVLKMYGAVVE